MARTALRRRLTWQTAAVTSVTRETASVVTIQLDPPAWPGHRAGQHLDVRLTAEDGYTAEGELRAGDELELRGPVGGYFVWEPGDGGPLMLLAGGSGIVPLRSILRHRHRTGSDVPARLLYSSRTLPDAIYRDELGQRHDGVQVSYTLTRGQPPGWTGHTGRINQALLRMSRRRSPCRRASRTRSPCPRAGRTKIPCDGGVGRTFTGSAGCRTYTPVSGQEGAPNASEGAATSSSPRAASSWRQLGAD